MILFRATRILCCVLALCSAVLAEHTGLTVVQGDAWREYDSHAIPFSYALISSRNRVVGAAKLPFYSGIKSFPSASRIYRVHVPISIVVRQGTRCDNATIAYCFSFVSTSSRGTNSTLALTDFRWLDIPLSPGPNEWTLSSDWMVECDKQFSRSDQGFLVEKSNGELDVRQKVSREDKVIGSVASLLFPFSVDYWALRRGIAGKWIESEFPNLVLRNVTGDEQFQNVHYMVFTDDPDSPCAGNLASNTFAALVRSTMKDWKNPYDPVPSYTNTVDQQPWATNFAAIDDPALAGAYLAYQLRHEDTNCDAADLLLRNLVERGETELASRVYARCIRTFPEWHEYWFRIYLPCFKDADERRAALVSYLRDHPDSIFAMSQLASSYVKEQQWRLAKKLLGRIVELQPSNVPAHATLAHVAEREGRQADAMTDRCRAVRLVQPVDPALTGFYGRGSVAYQKFILGDAALNASNIDRGVALLRSALSADPTFFPALLRVADYYAHIGVAATARANFLEALGAAPGQPKAIAGLAALHQSADKPTAVRKYQDQLWSVLKPVVDDEVRVRNWTNAVSLTQCMLAGYPRHAEALKLNITALLRLGLYDVASAKLYHATDPNRHDPEIIALWADACRIINADQHVVVFSEEPIEWNKRALSAWTDVLKCEPSTPRAHLERALIHLDDGDVPRAYRALRDLYKLRRSPEVALWIADLCLSKAEEHTSLNIPDLSNKSYVDEASDWYRKVLVAGSPTMLGSTDHVLYSPAAYRGLARAAALRDERSTEPPAVARECLRYFPAALDVRATALWRNDEAGGTPPAVWAPLTNAFDMCIPLDRDVADLRERIARARNNDPALVRAMAISAAAQLQWCRLLRKDGIAKTETQGPLRYYSFEKNDDYRFILARHTFVVPVAAPQWYAIRSRFTSGDLKNGNTRWWHRQELVVEANRIVTEAAMLQRHQVLSNSCALASSWLYGIDLNQRAEPFNAEGCYAAELLRCFYDSGSPRTNTRVTARLILAPMADGIDRSPLPYTLRSLLAIPPKLRHLYVPAACLDFLPHADRDRALQVIADDGWATAVLSNFSWPDNEAAARMWSSAHQTPGLDADARPVFFEVPSAPQDTSSWVSSGAVPLFRNAVVPQFPSPFAATLDAVASNLVLDVSWANVPAAFSCAFILTPAPMKRSVASWPDEALAIECDWTSTSNAVLKAYVRTYRREKGMPIGAMGIQIGEAVVPAFKSLWWRVDGGSLKVGTDQSAALIDAPHLLSPFAWQQGIYLGIEFPNPSRSFKMRLDGLQVRSK